MGCGTGKLDKESVYADNPGEPGIEARRTSIDLNISKPPAAPIEGTVPSPCHNIRVRHSTAENTEIVCYN